MMKREHQGSPGKADVFPMEAALSKKWEQTSSQYAMQVRYETEMTTLYKCLIALCPGSFQESNFE